MLRSFIQATPQRVWLSATNPLRILIMPSIDDLSDNAKLAYQAFLDMRNSKTAHFRCLQTIESTYVSGGVPSIAENLELLKLLTNHDRNVLAFKTAMSAITDDIEKRTLIEFMS